jgi:hypothetical protein
MGVQLFTNGASSTLSGTLSQGGTTMTLAAGTGSKFPSVTGSDFFLVTLFTKDVGGVEQNIEVVKVTARVGDTLTIVRDFENITGQSGGFAYDGTATTVFVHLRWTAASAGGMLQKSGNLAGLADNAVARANLGLGNVNNTSDANKPISAAQQTALDAKAPVNNAALTGNTTVDRLNGGATSGLKNAIMNGCRRISLRGNGAAVLGANRLGADGVVTFIGGWSSITGTQISQEAGPNDTRFTSGALHYVALGTMTGASGSILFQDRIEAADSAQLGGKSITVSCKLMSWVTAPSNYYYRIYKANAKNDFTGTTLVAQSPSYGAMVLYTAVEQAYTFTLAAADSVNGLHIECAAEYTGAVGASSYLFQGDVQCKASSKLEPFELRPIALELALRRRYLRKQAVWVGTSTARTVIPIDMVKTPTIAGGGTGYISTGTDKDTLVCYQTTAELRTLTLDSEL